jgi:hypothetical protein
MSAPLRSTAALLCVVGACMCAAAIAEPAGSVTASASWIFSPRVGAACDTWREWLVCSRGKLALSMKPTGRPRRGRPAGYAPPPPIAPTMLYLGNEWSDGEFACVVRRSGLTCRNEARRGWDREAEAPALLDPRA